MADVCTRLNAVWVCLFSEICLYSQSDLYLT